MRPGTEIEIDNQDGTTTTVDLRQHPDAIRKNERGEIEIATDRETDHQKARNIRPGDPVKKPDED